MHIVVEVGDMDTAASLNHGPKERQEDGVQRVVDRYGDAARGGFQPLPDVLLFHQAELDIRSEDLNVLLNILAHWYRAEEMPFVRPTTIAKRMGVSSRTVQRSIARLRKLNLLGRGDDVQSGERFDVSPLIRRLQPFAAFHIARRKAAKG